jgi:hypothetical protein
MEHKNTQSTSGGYSYSDVNIQEQYDTTSLGAIMGRFAEAMTWRNDQ